MVIDASPPLDVKLTWIGPVSGPVPVSVIGVGWPPGGIVPVATLRLTPGWSVVADQESDLPPPLPTLQDGYCCLAHAASLLSRPATSTGGASSSTWKWMCVASKGRLPAPSERVIWAVSA